MVFDNVCDLVEQLMTRKGAWPLDVPMSLLGSIVKVNCVGKPRAPLTWRSRAPWRRGKASPGSPQPSERAREVATRAEPAMRSSDKVR
jgi:hypothetical protein